MSGAVPVIKSLQRLWHVAQGDTGGARVCVKLLLGMYNGQRFPFDLTELRCLDEELLDAALIAIRMDSRPAMEVHELLNKLYGTQTMGARFELLACDWNLKGKCNRENEASARAHLQQLAQREADERAARKAATEPQAAAS